MYNHRLMDDGQNVKRPALPVKVEEILLPHGADKLIDRTAADEKLPMTAASDFGKKVLLRVVEVDPGQGAAGSHNGTDRPIGQADHTANHFLFNGGVASCDRGGRNPAEKRQHCIRQSLPPRDRGDLAFTVPQANWVESFDH